jgi:hypothetical protein
VGAVRVRGVVIGISVVTTLAEAEILALDGTPTKVATLWAERPVVLVFLRHFG